MHAALIDFDRPIPSIHCQGVCRCPNHTKTTPPPMHRRAGVVVAWRLGRSKIEEGLLCVARGRGKRITGRARAARSFPPPPSLPCRRPRQALDCQPGRPTHSICMDVCLLLNRAWGVWWGMAGVSRRPATLVVSGLGDDGLLASARSCRLRALTPRFLPATTGLVGRWSSGLQGTAHPHSGSSEWPGSASVGFEAKPASQSHQPDPTPFRLFPRHHRCTHGDGSSSTPLDPHLIQSTHEYTEAEWLTSCAPFRSSAARFVFNWLSIVCMYVCMWGG